MDKTTVYKCDCGHYASVDESRVVNIKVRICNECPMPHIIWGEVEDSPQPQHRIPASPKDNPFMKPTTVVPVEPIVTVIPEQPSQYTAIPKGVDLAGVNLNDERTTLLIHDPVAKAEYLKNKNAGPKNPFLKPGINVEPIDGINDGQVAMIRRSTLGG